MAKNTYAQLSHSALLVGNAMKDYFSNGKSSFSYDVFYGKSIVSCSGCGHNIVLYFETNYHLYYIKYSHN